jgi:hypothetical protein
MFWLIGGETVRQALSIEGSKKSICISCETKQEEKRRKRMALQEECCCRWKLFFLIAITKRNPAE